MELYWNKLTLDRPPTTSWRCVANEFDSTSFLKSIDRVTTELESQSILKTEAALLSRLIYRMKSKLRSDKGLKNMEKINRALLNYLKISLEKEYQYLRDNTECDGDIKVLPSRQMLQYVLVRTQGFAKLMCRVEDVARCAAEYFRSRINLGHAWNLSIVAYSVICRIWLLARYLTKRSCNWYNRMYKYLYKLTMIGVPWLPESYKFPEELKSWVSVNWIDEQVKSIPKREGPSDSIFDLISKNEDVEEDIELERNETKGTKISLVPKTPEIKVKSVDSVVELSVIRNLPVPSQEIGERISRDAFEADLAKQTTKIERRTKRKPIGEVTKKINKRPKLLSLDNLKTKQDLINFLSVDSYPGLDKLRWKMLRQNVGKQLLKLDKLDCASNPKKHDILLKKTIVSLREWII